MLFARFLAQLAEDPKVKAQRAVLLIAAAIVTATLGAEAPDAEETCPSRKSYPRIAMV
jgi:hypothetical protein